MTDYKTARFLLLSMILAATAGTWSAGCDDDGSADGDTDSDSDSDTDSDSDSDTDSDSDSDSDSDTDLADCSDCTADVCFNRIEGQIITEGEAPLSVQICAPSCMPATVEEDGSYYIDFTSNCSEFPLSTGEDIHVTISENVMDASQDTHTRYTYGFHPTSEDLVADTTLVVPDLHRLELPTTGVDYTAAGGADVSDLDGVSIDIAAGQLGDEDTLVRVFQHPLGDDTPPFVPDDVELSALFFLSPYFWGETPFTVEIDATIPGWADGAPGTVYQLGDYSSSQFLTCPGSDENVELGELVECGSATVSGGVVTIDDVKLLGWIGLGPAPE